MVYIEMNPTLRHYRGLPSLRQGHITGEYAIHLAHPNPAKAGLRIPRPLSENCYETKGIC